MICKKTKPAGSAGIYSSAVVASVAALAPRVMHTAAPTELTYLSLVVGSDSPLISLISVEVSVLQQCPSTNTHPGNIHTQDNVSLPANSNIKLRQSLLRFRMCNRNIGYFWRHLNDQIFWTNDIPPEGSVGL